MCWRSIFLVARHQKCLKLSFYRAVWRNSADGWSEKKIRKLKPSLFQRWLPSLNKNKCEKAIYKETKWMVCADWELLVLTYFWVFGPSCAVFVNVSNSSDSAGFVHYKHILRGERWDGELLYNTCRRVLLGFFLDGCSVNIHCDILIFNDVFISVILGTGISAVTPCFEAHTWDFILDAKYFSRCC